MELSVHRRIQVDSKAQPAFRPLKRKGQSPGVKAARLFGVDITNAWNQLPLRYTSSRRGA
jgi:hypothetical protein